MSAVIGPRLDPPTDVPTLRPGFDRMPKQCGQCGTHGPHNAEPPLGRDRHGMVTCRACGRLLAWVLNLPRAVALPAPAAALRPRGVSALSRPPVPLSTAEWRLPGCGVACQRDRHDPWQHEAHARKQILAEIEIRAERPSGVVQTGSLTVDFDASCAYVDGDDVSLTPTEFRLLSALAREVGKAYPYESLTRLVWGDAQFNLGEPARHTLRIAVTRLRAKLGPARRLVLTVPTIGLRLLNEPVP